MELSVEQVLTGFGAVLCLGGWIVFWIGSRLLGITFGLGMGFGFGMVLALIMRLQSGGESLVLLSCSLLGAFGGFLLVRVVSSFLFALLGFLFGVLLGRIGLDVYYLMHNQAVQALTPTTGALLVGSGLVMALFAVWLQKYIMILITSYVGATFLVLGVAALRAHERAALLGVFVGAVLWQIFWTTQLVGRGGRASQEKNPS